MCRISDSIEVLYISDIHVCSFFTDKSLNSDNYSYVIVMCEKIILLQHTVDDCLLADLLWLALKNDCACCCGGAGISMGTGMGKLRALRGALRGSM
ncbi:hypothetical protein BpHYR1_016798 [Brachionus plicatilis]|uniref:Uncharacterized protein n=1 Tax=Brachionus plicatilis TaxID=10195 RepID=A0A3M7RLY9_BRAPC|nr:hypothetical protein BpHYR1_016798 [Brachionus plicatilis]